MKDYNLLFDHILESISWIEKHCRNQTEKTFEKSVKTQDSTIRRLAIIGEATKGIPFRIKKLHPDIKWEEIIGMRNFLVHEYFNVSIPMIWQIIKEDVPIFKKQIKKILLKGEIKN